MLIATCLAVLCAQSFGSGKASMWPVTGPGCGIQVQKLPASRSAMAPSSGGACRFHFEMRRRLAAMDAAINQDCDRAPTTAANRKERRMAWVGHLPASFTFERAQVETTLQRRLWRILCGSGMKPGLLAILATQRAQRVKREEHQVGMSVHELLLGMPLSAMWLPGRAFGLAPEKAWTKHRDGELRAFLLRRLRGIKEEFSKLRGRPLSWPTRTTWTARRSRFSASTARGRPICWPSRTTTTPWSTRFPASTEAPGPTLRW